MTATYTADRPLRVLSLGAGVQSTTLALMAAQGEIGPMPDCAIFADTGAEPAPVYEHLQWLMSDNVLPFPVHVVNQGNLKTDLMAGRNSTGQRFASIPFHGISPAGKEMMARRQCTAEYKLSPIMRKARELVGAERPRPGVVEMWIGISLDEVQRMKPARVKYIRNRWPLLELRMRRHECLQWLERNGYPTPPKSACTFCPFRRNTEWRWLRDNDAAGFAEAIEVDDGLRAGGRSGRFKSALYLHSSRVPLRDADIRSDEDRGQGNLFINECEGMCGV